MTQPFKMIEKALRELIDSKMEDVTTAQIGGDLSYTTEDEFYIFLGLIGGSTTVIDGEWSVDIDVFDNDYTQAMERALDLEAILLKRGGHRTSLMLIDNVYQNESPTSRPWDDENAFRVGATYTFTARRSG